MTVQELDDVRWRLSHVVSGLNEIRGKSVSDCLPANPLEFDPEAITERLRDPHLLFVHKALVTITELFDKFEEMTAIKGNE